MKRFLFKTTIYLILLLGICSLIQYLVDSGLHKYNVGNYGVWNEIFAGKINSDIIIQGSSRALVQFDPKIIEKNTGFSCYNLGISGGKFISQKAKWDSYIANNKLPKILIQNVDVGSLIKEDHIFNKVQYLPYLSEQTIITNLRKIDKKIFLEKIIPLYKYRGFRQTVFTGLKLYFNIKPKTEDISYHGYAGLKKTWNQDFSKLKTRLKEQNAKSAFRDYDLKFDIEYPKELMKECRMKGIDLILIYSPTYYELLQFIPQKHSVDSLFFDLANKYNMQYWDYTTDSICYKKEYFYNSTHLNIKGAEIFSANLANDLNKYIQQRINTK
jgi:hypothetical protein